MFAAWSVCAICFVSVFGVRAAPFEDDPLIEKVKEVIAEVDDYLAAHHLTELLIPNLDFPLSPLKIRNGGFGDFSTMELQDGASVNETKLDNNATGYTFNVKVGLEELRFHYDYEVNTIIFKQAGNFSISVLDNSAELTGFVIVASDKSCKAALVTAKVLKYSNYVIDLEPNNIPGITALSQQVLNFVTPFILPFSNGAIQASLLVPPVQQLFSEFACEKIVNL